MDGAKDSNYPVRSNHSLIAREVGIPAMVATSDATERLDDGEVVNVEGYLQFDSARTASAGKL